MNPLIRWPAVLIALPLILGAAYSRGAPYCSADSNPEHCATLENQIRYRYFPPPGYVQLKRGFYYIT